MCDQDAGDEHEWKEWHLAELRNAPVRDTRPARTAAPAQKNTPDAPSCSSIDSVFSSTALSLPSPGDILSDMVAVSKS